jgi:hypothetical protein
MFKRGNPTNAKLLSTDENGFEYWLYGNDVYRCKAGNRGYMLSEGTPANARWECTYAHYKKYLAPKGELGNPDTTPDDPKEIAQDLRILKAKQKLVRLEQGSIKNSASDLSSSNFRKEEVTGIKKDGSRVTYHRYIYETKSGMWVVTLYEGQMYFTKNNQQVHTSDAKHKEILSHFGLKLGNPSSLSSSESLVEEFHGRAPDSIDDIYTDESFPSSLAELGELRELVVIVDDKYEVPIGFDEQGKGVVILASAPGGCQYCLVGGDQSLDSKSLKEFGITLNDSEEWQRKVVLGPLYKLTYFTDKHHLEGPKYQKNGCLYEHELGEEGGELPTLLYDPNNETLEIVGGSYITRAEGIRN